MNKKVLMFIMALLVLSMIPPIMASDGSKIRRVARAPASVVQDRKGDWVTYGLGPGAPYSDVRQAKIGLVDMHTVIHDVEEIDDEYEDRAYMRVSMVVGGKPPRTPSELYLAYVWHFDLDRDGDFSDFPGDVNARVFWDGNRWNAFLDGIDFAGIPFRYTITGRHVTFTFPLSVLNNPTSFSWFGLTYQRDASDNLVATDWVSTATWSSH